MYTHTHTPNATYAQAWTGGDTEWQTSLTLHIVGLPLLGLLDLGQSELAMFVDRLVERLDDIDDPGLPVHGAQTLIGNAVYEHCRDGDMHAMAA